MTSLAANAIKRLVWGLVCGLLHSGNGQGVKVGWRFDYWTVVKPIILRCFDDGAYTKVLDDVALVVVYRLIAKQRAMHLGICVHGSCGVGH